jgi:gamma-butyrobetaine dioxygenase
MTMNPIDVVLDLLARQGNAAYLGEPVSQVEHALQAGWLAEQVGVPPSLIAAALLHDIGHLLDPRAADPHTTSTDLEHEELGARWLEEWFGPAVSVPVRLHVPAKRYLCAVEPGYLENLSSASTASLRLQGGPFTPEEVRTFESDPLARAAVALRRWDDQAKVPSQDTPGLEHFRPILEQARGS